jgi:predicted TIM-barrel enzyme
MEVADGVIVGSSIKQDGEIANPVDVNRVRRFVAAARGGG